jgi:hypothetical protein
VTHAPGRRLARGPVVVLLSLLLLALPAQAMATAELPSQADWLNSMRAGQSLDLPGKVMRARSLFNNIAWSPDADPDGHWATPAELLRRGSGDLLDLVTAYYFTLRGMGVAADDIRMFFGKLRTLDEPVAHILLAVRERDGTTYFVDPLRVTAMTDETPSHFRPTLAFNEAGTWRASALTDLSIWSSIGAAPDNVPRWAGVCHSTLGMMGMLQPTPIDVVAVLEKEPPAAGVPTKAKKTKARGGRRAPSVKSAPPSEVVVAETRR